MESKKELANRNPKLVMLPVSDIQGNPSNPRKDLGDLGELTESIRKNGIMQNLTVVEGILPDGRKGYTVLIGHRRLAAAKEAGLTEVPCVIAKGLSKADELKVMLEENMQRNDLTIAEQAQSFQLLMDLGETEESIAEKSGFSRTTVRRRLAIAKLDQSILERKIAEPEFQLSFGDLYALEEVKDIDERNRILNKAASSQNLRWLVTQFTASQKRKENTDKVVSILTEAGVKQEKKSVNESKFERVLTIWSSSMDDKDRNELDKLLKKPEGLVFISDTWSITIYRPYPDGKKPLSDYEKSQKERDDRSRKLKNLYKKMVEEQRVFIANLIESGKREDDLAVKDRLWGLILGLHAIPEENDMISLMAGMEYFKVEMEERSRLRSKVKEAGVMYQMMSVA